MITAIVPAKKKSIRVQNKNFRKFGNTTLLDFKIKNLKKSKKIDKIIIHSDTNQAKVVAKKNKIDFIRREPYFASSKCSGSEFFKNLAETVNSEYIVYAPCTAPFIKIKTIDKLINFFLNNKKKFDSIMTVSNLYEHMWFKKKPLNYKLNKSPNSQDLPPIQRVTYGFSIISRKNMLKFSNVIGPNPYFWPVNDVEATDIDTSLDFFIAEQILKFNKF